MQTIEVKESNRARKPLQEMGQMRWTERDLAALPWIGEQYAVRMDQLQRLLVRWTTTGPTKAPGQLGIETVRKVVQRWKQAELVESAVLVRQQPGWVWLTRRGLEQTGLTYLCWEPKMQQLRHLYAINAVRLWVEQREPEARWRSKRQLHHEQGLTRKQVRQGQRPDGEVELRGQPVAIEVELSDKMSGRLAAILYELARTYAGIWYFCSPATLGVMQRAVAQLSEPARRKFSLIELPL